MIRPTVPINLLSLELVLNTFAVRCVADQGEYRSYTFDKQTTLGGLCIIKRGLEVKNCEFHLGRSRSLIVPAHNNCRMSHGEVSLDVYDSAIPQ